MKNKVLFGLISCGLLIGTTVYTLIIKKKKMNFNDSGKGIDKNDSVIVSNENNIEQELVDFYDVKTESASSIYNRHKEASEIIKESMENINRNSEVNSEHKHEFDDMLDDLDALSEKR